MQIFDLLVCARDLVGASIGGKRGPRHVLCPERGAHALEHEVEFFQCPVDRLVLGIDCQPLSFEHEGAMPLMRVYVVLISQTD